MPTLSDLKKSKYLSKEDVKTPILATIKDYEEVEIKGDQGTSKRWILIFKEDIKPLVLNSTNGQIIAQIAGTGDFDGWMGWKVVLYHDPNVSMGGKLVGGIRVRAPKAAAQRPTTMPQAVQAARHAKVEEKTADEINDEIDLSTAEESEEVPF